MRRYSRWARLVFEMREDDKRIDFSCTNLPRMCAQGSKRALQY
jgi:hypothetical protein